MSGSRGNATDNERLTRWVREHARAVRAYLAASSAPADLADDLLQEVFRKAWQARGGYREEGVARAYLIKIADRLLIDRWRRPSRESQVDGESWRRLEPPARDANPDTTTTTQEAKQLLNAALDQITPQQRRVLLLRYYGEMEFSQIAETTQLPINTVLSHCRRGLLKLRKLLVENPL